MVTAFPETGRHVYPSHVLVSTFDPEVVHLRHFADCQLSVTFTPGIKAGRDVDLLIGKLPEQAELGYFKFTPTQDFLDEDDPPFKRLQFVHIERVYILAAFQEDLPPASSAVSVSICRRSPLWLRRQTPFPTAPSSS